MSSLPQRGLGVHSVLRGALSPRSSDSAPPTRQNDIFIFNMLRTELCRPQRFQPCCAWVYSYALLTNQVYGAAIDCSPPCHSCAPPFRRGGRLRGELWPPRRRDRRAPVRNRDCFQVQHTLAGCRPYRTSILSAIPLFSTTWQELSAKGVCLWCAPDLRATSPHLTSMGRS